MTNAIIVTGLSNKFILENDMTYRSNIDTTRDTVFEQYLLVALPKNTVNCRAASVGKNGETLLINAEKYVFCDDIYGYNVEFKSRSKIILMSKDEEVLSSKIPHYHFHAVPFIVNYNVTGYSIQVQKIYKGKYIGSFTIPVIKASECTKEKISEILIEYIMKYELVANAGIKYEQYHWDDGKFEYDVLGNKFIKVE